jgi:hypothetical protein
MDAEYQKDLDWLAESKNWTYINCRFEDVKGVNQPRELTDRSTLSSLMIPNAWPSVGLFIDVQCSLDELPTGHHQVHRLCSLVALCTQMAVCT